MFGDVAFAQAPFASLGGNTFAVSVSETGSVVESSDQIFTAGGLINESALAVATQTVITSFVAASNETVSSAAVFNTLNNNFSVALSDGVSTGDQYASQVTFVGSRSETASSAAAFAGQSDLVGSVSETASAVEAFLGGLLLLTNISETASAGADFVSQVSFVTAVTEGVSASAVFASQTAFVAAVQEAASSIDASTVATTFVAAIAEAGVAIARIVIDTQRANIAFAASVAPLGPAGAVMAASYALKNSIAAGFAIATITAQGIQKLVNINIAKGQSEQSSSSTGGNQYADGSFRGYAEGGLIGGRRHAQGGTLIEAEAGEAIMTRGAVTMFAPLLSTLNQMGGGTTFGSTMVSTYDKPVDGNNMSEQTIIKTYVVEGDLTSAQHRQARLKDLSTL
jgi:hypothetical protein